MGTIREIACPEIRKAVCELFIEANTVLPESLTRRIRSCSQEETCPSAKGCFDDVISNFQLAKREGLPVCQDTGMAVVFAEIGQDVHFTEGDFEEAVNDGVRDAYLSAAFRCSVVRDPIRRGNTGDNTPAILYTRIVPGDRVTLTAAPKGFGSENMSRQIMLTPAANEDTIVDFIVDTVSRAGSNPCPPVVVGVGIGGDFEYSALLAKKALCRSVDERNADPFYAQLEGKALDKINALGIGSQGFGGDITALAVNVETYPTHIAGLPVAVNIGCHVTRHAEKTI